MFDSVVVEPSDTERSEWPDATRAYVEHLESKTPMPLPVTENDPLAALEIVPEELTGERVIFLDIDGPMIPATQYLLGPDVSYQRRFAQLPMLCLIELCKRARAKVVFNTTHNRDSEGVPPIETCMTNAGLPAGAIHPDSRTAYPDLHRVDAVNKWLAEHPGVDWLAFDDVFFTNNPRLIWIDANAGLHLGHVNEALYHFNERPIIVLI